MHHIQSRAPVLPASVRSTLPGRRQALPFDTEAEGLKVTSQEISAHLRHRIKGHQNLTSVSRQFQTAATEAVNLLPLRHAATQILCHTELLHLQMCDEGRNTGTRGKLRHSCAQQPEDLACFHPEVFSSGTVFCHCCAQSRDFFRSLGQKLNTASPRHSSAHLFVQFSSSHAQSNHSVI